MTPRGRGRRRLLAQAQAGAAARRAALYTRVSTEDQAKEGFSLEAQLRQLRAYCVARGFEIGGEYVDEGKSARKENRPAYQRMLEERGKWDLILVLKMDRIHRNARNFANMMDVLKRDSKDFVSISESWDTSTPMGRFTMNIVQQLAELESEQTGDRTHTGMTEKALQGAGEMGRRPPFGYRSEGGHLIPEPDQATVVLRIFKAYARGDALQAIADDLDLEGVPGRKWSPDLLRRMLSNPTYNGTRDWDGIVLEAAHPPLVAQDVWDGVQKRLAVFRVRRKRIVASRNDATINEVPPAPPV
jgi:site-specific DNA recombinase